MDYNQYLKSKVNISSCAFDSLADQKKLLKSRDLSIDFWKQVESRLKLTQFKLVDAGEACPWKVRKFENLFWLPTSQQLKNLWGLKFEGQLCADDFDECKIKINSHWSKGKRIVVGDEIYISKGSAGSK